MTEAGYRSKWLAASGGTPLTRRQIIFKTARAMTIITAVVTAVLCYVTQPIFRPERVTLPVHASADRLKNDVNHLVNDFEPRTWRSIVDLDSAGTWLHATIEAMGLPAEFQEYEAKGTIVRNVMTFVGPKDGPRIVIGAHYDACVPGVGADDNASGVAGVLELARLFKESPPKIRVDLVLWTLEEPPFFRSESMGSFIHAKSLKDAKVDVRLALSLEMIGYFDDRPGSQSYPLIGLGLLYPTVGNYIAVVGAVGDGNRVRRVKKALAATTDLDVRSINGPRGVPGIDLSDHRSYWENGLPALMITDTAFFRNANYHKASDTPDTLDYKRMAKVVEGVFGIVMDLAAAE